MLISYLKLSLRLIVSNPIYSFVNIFGLAVGLVSFYILWEYSTSELKSDQYHKDFNRIAHIGHHWEWTDDGGKTWGHITLSAMAILVACIGLFGMLSLSRRKNKGNWNSKGFRCSFGSNRNPTASFHISTNGNSYFYRGPFSISLC